MECVIQLLLQNNPKNVIIKTIIYQLILLQFNNLGCAQLGSSSAGFIQTHSWDLRSTGGLPGASWFRMASFICLATDADCQLMLLIGWDNGDDGPCVFGRLAWANSHGDGFRDSRTSKRGQFPFCQYFQVSFDVTFIIVSLAKTSHMVYPRVIVRGTPQSMCTGRCEDIVTMPTTVYHMGQMCHTRHVFLREKY